MAMLCFYQESETNIWRHFSETRMACLLVAVAYSRAAGQQICQPAAQLGSLEGCRPFAQHAGSSGYCQWFCPAVRPLNLTCVPWHCSAALLMPPLRGRAPWSRCMGPVWCQIIMLMWRSHDDRINWQQAKRVWAADSTFHSKMVW